MLGIWGYFLFIKPKTKQKKLSDHDAYQILLKATKELKNIWEMGDVFNQLGSENQKCSEFLWNKNTPKHFQQCNPFFLECLFAGKFPMAPYIKIMHDKKEYLVAPEKKYQAIPSISQEKRRFQFQLKPLSNSISLPSTGVSLSLKIKYINEPTLEVFLQNTCGNTYLPEKIYEYGNIKKNLRHNRKIEVRDHWDNWGRDIFVDKYLVNQQDIFLWKLAKGKNLSEQFKPELFYQTATGLSKSEMKEYCLDHGKKLLDSKVFDALTSFQSIYQKNLLKRKRTYPFGFTEETTDNFIRPFSSRDRGSDDFELSKECQKVYTLECKEKFGDHHPYSLSSPSWNGVFQVFGGWPEYMDAPIYPRENTKASNFYFTRFSKNHLWGQRLNLEKEYIEEIKSITKKQIAFRCQTEVFEE
jgi:hypothetical protein